MRIGRTLRQAATRLWRDESGLTWLETAPLLRRQVLLGHENGQFLNSGHENGLFTCLDRINAVA